MCLTCKPEIGIQGEAVKTAFVFKGKDGPIYLRTYIHTHDNQIIELTKEQKDEIMENALVVICTGIDFSIDVWAIQWDRDYKVKTL